jgi:chromosome condensin MukBEF MukE localization factor
MRIGHFPPHGRIEEGIYRVGFDIAAGEDASEKFRQRMTLCDRKRSRSTPFVQPVAPSAPGRRILDAEK